MIAEGDGLVTDNDRKDLLDERERERDRQLRAAGYTAVHFTWREIFQTPEAVIARLRSALAGRTVVLVAHRLSTVARMDQLVVLDHGRIIEKGTHQQLLSLDGMYARLWQHQSGGFIDDTEVAAQPAATGDWTAAR